MPHFFVLTLQIGGMHPDLPPIAILLTGRSA
jgi:hypothetical protein